MPVDYSKLLATPIPDVENTYTERDTMLYALAVGMAADPTDRRELGFVLEGGRLRVLPTMATVLVWDDTWLYRAGLDMTKVLHGEQHIRLHRPLPPAASVVARTRVVDAFAKGPGRGTIVLAETEIRDRTTGAALVTNLSVAFARGDDVVGSPAGSGPAPHPIPARAPDVEFEQRTLPIQALLYRLCGDRNPLHADPDYAARGGFPRPILHGLCTLGHAGAAVVRAGCDYDADRVEELGVRFTRPVFPGDTLRTEMWRDGRVISFRTRAVERDELALDHGKVVLRASS